MIYLKETLIIEPEVAAEYEAAVETAEEAKGSNEGPAHGDPKTPTQPKGPAQRLYH